MIPHPSSPIEKWLKQHDSHALECDGMTRLLSSLLKKAGVAHSMVIGEICFYNRDSLTHFWIDLPSNLTIDIRAQMWSQAICGKTDGIPHGLFDKSEFPSVGYVEHQKDFYPADWAASHQDTLNDELWISSLLTMLPLPSLALPEKEWFDIGEPLKIDNPNTLAAVGIRQSMS